LTTILIASFVGPLSRWPEPWVLITQWQPSGVPSERRHVIYPRADCFRQYPNTTRGHYDQLNHGNGRLCTGLHLLLQHRILPSQSKNPCRQSTASCIPACHTMSPTSVSTVHSHVPPTSAGAQLPLPQPCKARLTASEELTLKDRSPRPYHLGPDLSTWGKT
jgi:hypothetical protein